MSQSGWDAYTEAARNIALILRDESDRAEALAAGARDRQAELDRLAERLAEQRRHLAGLATTLRRPVPYFDGIVPGPITDPAEALCRATSSADTADAAAYAAHRRAARPLLLPGLAPSTRNTLLYAAAAILVSALSLLLAASSRDPDFGGVPVQVLPWSLCGFPAVAFFAGYLTIRIAGQPRIGPRHGYSAKAGGAICYLGMLILWSVFIAATT